MPWNETSPVFEKALFVSEWFKNEVTKCELCERFGVSRKAGYELMARWRSEGDAAFAGRSRAPRNSPNAVSPEVRKAIIALRVERPTWGPKKLLACLRLRFPEVCWPSGSTAGEILRGAGLTEPQRRRRRASPRRGEVARTPNDKWCADFKGNFLVQNKTRCDPLTVTDDFSRMLLGCWAMSPPVSTHQVIGHFTSLFREYGMPLTIQTDNGPPFSAAGPLGLTHLSTWWIRCGISPRRIEPGKPQQNGRHERMHRTLKAEAICPPAGSIDGQQRRFDAFRKDYDFERPHEGIGLVTPASLYVPSLRAFPEQIPDPEYGEDAIIRRVSHQGCIKWRREAYFFSSTLAHEHVRLVPHDEEPIISVIYYRELVGRIDLKQQIALPPDPGALPQTPEFSAFRPMQEEAQKEEKGGPP